MNISTSLFISKPTFNSLFHITQNLHNPEVLSRYNGPDTVNISIILYNYISQSPFAFVYNRIQDLTALAIQILSRKSAINALYICFSIEPKLADMGRPLNQTVKSAYVHNRALCRGSGNARVKKL